MNEEEMKQCISKLRICADFEMPYGETGNKRLVISLCYGTEKISETKLWI